MTTFDIVPAFNVFEDRCPGFNSGSISVKIDLFCFEGMEKGFTAGVIIATPFSAHALSGPCCDQFSTKGDAGILHAPIRMDESALCLDFAGYRPCQKPL
jgi:hypothetical protein